ncbi:Fis family transcriptional regulator [Mycobacteroides abscessus subsp. massiliense]|uniref:DUF3263 domain-containing protein n=1 Tax=Mycobacteroides abscessus TaxID=36809 RepID=UPI0009A59A17|nr:DUF3263 domain-containing protein [Mycobacteroides abscessus]SKU69859.1 Fis family transcriptional regulator [Mycobacteroides abscessus subsp. massiliense]SKU77039.1 Fis family transcriptional regulator [Mycobacteroides abscessus subsp. massiliense]
MNAVEVLEFERIWWKHSGQKEEAIRAEFGLSPTRYYQRLNQLLSEPEALEIEPVVVNRLLRIRTVNRP